MDEDALQRAADKLNTSEEYDRFLAKVFRLTETKRPLPTALWESDYLWEEFEEWRYKEAQLGEDCDQED